MAETMLILDKPLAATRLAIIDTDPRRRCAVSNRFAALGAHAEPFESVAEYASYQVDVPVVLVADTGETVGALAQAMAEKAFGAIVVAYGDNPSPSAVVSALELGASDYLELSIDDASLAQRIERTIEKFAALANSKERLSKAKVRMRSLTVREREILDQVIEGRSTREIGSKLAISPRTVENHRANIMNKMLTKNTAQLIRSVIEAQLFGSRTSILNHAFA